MKTKSLIVIAILTLGLITSCQEENESLRTDAELIQSLKADIEFQDFFNEARSTQLLVTEKIVNWNSMDGLNKVKNSHSLDEIFEHLDLDSNLFTELDIKLMHIADYLSSNYPEFKLKTEEEIRTIVRASIFKDFSFYDLVLSNLPNARVMDACDDKFEADFHRIHAEHDSGVETCFVVTLVTLGAGFVPCNAANIFNTSMKLAAAMDEHSACKNQ